MIKSISLLLAGFLLLPNFFTHFLGLLLLWTLIWNLLTLILPHLCFQRDYRRRQRDHDGEYRHHDLAHD